MIFCVSGKREATHQAGEDGGQGGAEAREQGITEGKMQIEYGDIQSHRWKSQLKIMSDITKRSQMVELRFKTQY